VSPRRSAWISAAACGRDAQAPPAAAVSARRPSILLVTLDTTRADAIGPDAVSVTTPAFNTLAARGARFRQAYATVPETLPSHVSMMTGLYPAGHGVHENGRSLHASHPVLAEQLKRAGYATSAFVSSFTLARRFGLARGFDVYDDALPRAKAERTALETTEAALAYLANAGEAPLFLWVHYFDPHHPYTPPDPFRSQYGKNPYLGEIAAMDQQLGRLLGAFEAHGGGPKAVVVVADHGEGLGEHGELLHGNLLYQSTMHVPLAIAGPGVASSVSEVPVSTRRVYHTILDWAGLGSEGSLRQPQSEVPLGEAMKPFLNYGWQPQVMAVEGSRKAILAGRAEIYDVVADPAEARDLAQEPAANAAVPSALRDYPVPSPAAARTPDTLDPAARRELASLGYVSAGAAPVVRKGAPRPADMVRLFELLDRASGLFVAERYAEVVPLLERILKEDPANLDTTLRLATAYSSLGRESRAVDTFRRAVELAPDSPDVRLYLALHYARGAQWERAVPLLEELLTAMPDRVAALEALADLRERQGRAGDAVALRLRLDALRTPTGPDLARLGLAAMASGQTDVAISAFERARGEGAASAYDLELGALYLAARRYADARAALDRVPPSHPGFPMALFKRAQVSVLLNEPDRAARVERARRGANAETRELIARERLFAGM